MMIGIEHLDGQEEFHDWYPILMIKSFPNSTITIIAFVYIQGNLKFSKSFSIKYIDARNSIT
jgi:hypothetical protein